MTITLNYTVPDNPPGDTNVDSTLVRIPAQGESGFGRVARCYEISEVVLYLLQEQAAGNIVIPPGQPFAVNISPQLIL